MDIGKARAYIEKVWSESITPALVEYIRIPNKSPAFDPDWEKNGHMARAIELARSWCADHLPKNAEMKVVTLPGRTPVLVVDVPGDAPGNIVLYGHLDKQPEMVGWADDLGPWKPVIRDGKLYGRGGADDGYAVFSSLTALNVLQSQGISHPRSYVMIECCEESGSYDLPAYIDHLKDDIGTPDLVVCLDSGAGNYDQLWMTTSLRGLVGGTLSVNVLNEGVHSGDASGVVPSSFRIMRMLLDRIEDPNTGALLLESLNVDIPEQRKTQAQAAAQTLGSVVSDRFPFVDGMGPVHQDHPELLLNRTWRPALSYTGIDGIPSLASAGNVLRPGTSMQLSLRTPPTVDAPAVYEELKAVLEKDPPYGAEVRFEGHGASGWHAPMLQPWLEDALETTSQDWFGKPAMYMGEGGTIPFMGMLGEKFPQAQFIITGVLGPNSNAHGPNEFLHLDMAKRLTGCVAQLIKEQGEKAH